VPRSGGNYVPINIAVTRKSGGVGSTDGELPTVLNRSIIASFAKQVGVPRGSTLGPLLFEFLKAPDHLNFLVIVLVAW
jgi:hypothetical protein